MTNVGMRMADPRGVEFGGRRSSGAITLASRRTLSGWSAGYSYDSNSLTEPMILSRLARRAVLPALSFAFLGCSDSTNPITGPDPAKETHAASLGVDLTQHMSFLPGRIPLLVWWNQSTRE